MIIPPIHHDHFANRPLAFKLEMTRKNEITPSYRGLMENSLLRQAEQDLGRDGLKSRIQFCCAS